MRGNLPVYTFLAGVLIGWGLYMGLVELRQRGVKKKRGKLLIGRVPNEILESEYKEHVLVAVDCVYRAGINISRAIDSVDKNISLKDKLGVDFATETDTINEDLIFTTLQNAFPNHKLIGEESSSELGSTPPLSDEPTWIVDPIDGTTNFAHHNPFCCVALGFCLRKEVVLGVVYAPLLDEFYIALNGKGAYFNGKRMKVSCAKTIRRLYSITRTLSINHALTDYISNTVHLY